MIDENSTQEIVFYIISTLNKAQLKSAIKAIETQQANLMRIPKLQHPTTDQLKTILEFQLKHYNEMHRKL